MINQTSTFNPNWISPPGNTILDLLEERSWNQRDLSTRLGLSSKLVNQLIKGKAPLTEKTADRLSSALGSSIAFWMNREAGYRAAIAKQDQEKQLAKWGWWLDRLPVKDLIHAKALPDLRNDEANRPSLVAAALGFFGVASPQQWLKTYGRLQHSFRRTKIEKSDLGAVSSWLRLGELEAEKTEAPKYSAAKFRKALVQIREMTVENPASFCPKLIEACRQAGVLLAFVPSISRAHISGVTRWFDSSRPMIQMSLYGKKNDKFWFTFFHEAAHVLKHKKGLILDEFSGKQSKVKEEIEANDFSREILIPSGERQELHSLQAEHEIKAFARKLNIHPGIVVGRLQHDEVIDYRTPLNYLRISYEIVVQSRN